MSFLREMIKQDMTATATMFVGLAGVVGLTLVAIFGRDTELASRALDALIAVLFLALGYFVKSKSK